MSEEATFAKPICAVEGCNKETSSRGWCAQHYQRWYRYGDAEITAKEMAKVNLRKGRWKEGQTGNPGGRPKGSRNAITQMFIAAITADFEKHGSTALARLRKENPGVYCQLVAHLIPKQIEGELNVRTSIVEVLAGFSDTESGQVYDSEVEEIPADVRRKSLAQH